MDKNINKNALQQLLKSIDADIYKGFILYIGIYFNVGQRRCFELPNAF